MKCHPHRMFVIAVACFAVSVDAASKDEWGPPPPWEREATPEWAMVEGTSCPMKRVDLKSLEKMPTVPTFIKGVVDGWPSFQAWQSKAAFLEEFGHLSIRPMEDEYGPLQHFMGVPDGKPQELRHFMENMEGKDSLEINLSKDSAAHAINKAAGSWKYPRSRWKFKPEPLLSIGGHGGSQSFRSDGSGWYGLIAGMKVWILYPPEMPEEALDTIGIASMKFWPERDYIKKLPKQYLQPGGGLRGRPMRCLQQAGEILWIPNYWWRASYNLGETLSVGAESKLFIEDSIMAVKKYPDSSRVNHHVMLHLKEKDEKQALEYGVKALKNGPNDPRIAVDYCAVSRKSGDEEEVCADVIKEYISNMEKLRSDELIMPGEAKQAIKLLQSALGSSASEDDDDVRHDEF